MISLAIFASGNGSNAQAMIDYFAGHSLVEVALIVSDNPQAYVLERARLAAIPAITLSQEVWRSGTQLVHLMQHHRIHCIVLAGYLKLIPAELVRAYPQRILNIHPALLPKYGGKGMYGARVHQAVIVAGERESGISIHYVNERYDEGELITQQRLEILPGWTATDLQQAIHALEHRWYPPTVEKICTAFNKI